MAIAENKNKIKYDRQLRIWGEKGQEALEKASVCLLNCSPTGSETLKNLVLGGIGTFTIVDGNKVEAADLGNNFFVDEQSLGKSRAKTVCTLIEELNDAVSAKFVEESPETMLATNPTFFSQFTLVIATQLSEHVVLKLDNICRQHNVMLVIARSYGLTGVVRTSLKQEHDVIESKPEHSLDDLRLHRPWPELKRFVDDFDIDTHDPVVHKHIPYVIILLKLAEEWRNNHNGMLPSTSEEKRLFKGTIQGKMRSPDEDNYKEAANNAYKVWSPPGRLDLDKILNDSASDVNSHSSDFWVMVAALKEFIANEGEGELPVDASIPDMTSSTEYYVSLQKVYQAKAEADYLAIEGKVRRILKDIGKDPDCITSTSIRTFCKNARKISVCRFRSLEEEFMSTSRNELQKYFGDVDYECHNVSRRQETTSDIMRTAVTFYILLRAADSFAAFYNRYPGVFDGELEEDASRLKNMAIGLLNEIGLNGANLSEDLVSEMCRFGASEIHAVAAFIGGIASQEAIKLITKQFVPFTGTFVFNGIDQKSQVLPL